MFRDKTDEKIIEFLRNDSRESFVDIGKKLKLSFFLGKISWYII